MFKLMKVATMAGLLGLVILHPEPFGKLANASVSAFRKAVRIV